MSVFEIGFAPASAMRKAAIILVLVSLQGCAAYNNMSPSEKAWQALNVVDAMQTLDVARNPRCYKEGNALTSAVIGEHPSEAEVVGFMVAGAVVHYQISRYMERKDAPMWLQKGFKYVSLGGKAITVGNNYSRGLHAWPDDHDSFVDCNY